MHTKSKLIVNVVELLEHPGSRKELRFSEPVEGLALELARIPDDEPVGFDLIAESLDDGIVVRGAVSGRYVATCRRCLTDVLTPFSFDAAEVYRPKRDAWEEGYVIEVDHIDLRVLARDNILLNLPVHPLCGEGCQGLCPECGANRNEEPCGCSQERLDLRWGALRDLFKDM